MALALSVVGSASAGSSVPDRGRWPGPTTPPPCVSGTFVHYATEADTGAVWEVTRVVDCTQTPTLVSGSIVLAPYYYFPGRGMNGGSCIVAKNAGDTYMDLWWKKARGECVTL